MYRSVFLIVAFLVIVQGEIRVWKKINQAQVCFEGRGNKFGHFRHHGPEKLVGALKLVHRSGVIRCASAAQYDSLWGCYRLPHGDIKTSALNVIVTDELNNVIFPLDKYITRGGARTGLWYHLPFTDSKHSKSLIFTDYKDPFVLPRNVQIRIWYGEDLRNYYEGDNSGRVCVDVYVHDISHDCLQ